MWGMNSHLARDRTQKIHMANYVQSRQGSTGLKVVFCLVYEGWLNLGLQCSAQTFKKIVKTV